MSKKYFWLKLKEDFFRDKWIKKLRRVAGGDTYTVIYLKMQLLSLKNEGLLYREDLSLEFHQELALEIDEDEENVLFTLMYLQNNSLIEEVNEGEFMLPDTVKAIGSESDSAERVRRYRQNKNVQKALQCNEQVTICNTEKEIEKEKEIYKESDLNLDSKNEEDEIKLVVSKYKELENLPGFNKITAVRKKAINARIREEGVEKVIAVLEGLNKDEYYVKAKLEGAKWYKFDYVFNPNKFNMLVERFENNSYNNYTTNQVQSVNQYKDVDVNSLYQGGEWE